MVTVKERRGLRRAFASAAAVVATGALLFGGVQPAGAVVYPGAYLFPASDTSKVADIWGANSASGAWVGTYSPSTGWNQRFTIVPVGGGSYQLQSQDGLCLRVGNYEASIGLRPIINYPCNASDPADLWSVAASGTGPIVNRWTGNCMDATSSTWVVDYPCHGGSNQRWSAMIVDWQ